MFIIGHRKQYKKPFTVPSPLTFSTREDLWDMPSLLDRFRRLETNTLRSVVAYLDRELRDGTADSQQLRPDRLRIYETFKACFTDLARAGAKGDKGSHIAEFKRNTDLVPFLGMPDVEDLRTQFVSKAWALQRVENKLNGNESRLSSAGYQRWTSEETELIRWFDERQKELVEIFRPYLGV